MKVNIRIMGDKELAYKVAEIIKESLSSVFGEIEFIEKPMYKDKYNRTEVDDEKIRLYASLGGDENER